MTGGEIEIPGPISEAIASWIRTIGHAQYDAKRGIFERAAIELMRLGESLVDAPVRQVIIDDLHELAVLADIDNDTAQAIMVRALASPPDRSNGVTNGFHEKAECTGALLSRCAADIAPERIEWLWPGRLARGKHTCIAGEPGTGKSQLTIAIAAAVSTAGKWPCGEGSAPLGNVIILSAEDGAADTIIPRLLAAGADLSRCTSFRPFATPMVAAVH